MKKLGHKQVANLLLKKLLAENFYSSFEFMLAAGPPSGFTTDGVSCWGEPSGEHAISLH
jgi:hypothetical protein